MLQSVILLLRDPHMYIVFKKFKFLIHLMNRRNVQLRLPKSNAQMYKYRREIIFFFLRYVTLFWYLIL